jgi:hypothetical protein
MSFLVDVVIDFFEEAIEQSIDAVIDWWEDRTAFSDKSIGNIGVPILCRKMRIAGMAVTGGDQGAGSCSR